MVRAGRGGGEHVDEFLHKGMVALGVRKSDRLDSALKKSDLLRLFAEKYPEMKEGARQTWSSQVFRFLSEIRTGDAVVTFDNEQRLYFLGTVTSDYEWNEGLVPDMPHVRRAQWTGHCGSREQR
jgi:restriction system protein